MGEGCGHLEKDMCLQLNAGAEYCIRTGRAREITREEAFALEIDDQFRLVVEYPDGRRAALSAGEVSVRGMYGYV